VMAAGTMVGCSIPGGSKTSPYVNGEIIHMTPNEWPQMRKRFPFMMLDGSRSPTKEGSRMAQQFADRASKHGRANGGLCKMEIKLIESRTAAPQSSAKEGDVRILSPGELNTFLRTIMRDPSANITSYPRMACRMGQTMTIRSVVNQPMLASSQSKKLPDGDASAVADIRYAPVGTMFWLCPVLTPSGRIHIENDLMISRIIGEEKFDGNPYPIVSAWTRAPALNLADGESAVLHGPIEGSGQRTHLVVTITR